MSLGLQKCLELNFRGFNHLKPENFTGEDPWTPHIKPPWQPTQLLPWTVSTFRSVRASSGSFLIKFELSKTLKLSIIPVLPNMSLFNQFSTRSVSSSYTFTAGVPWFISVRLSLWLRGSRALCWLVGLEQLKRKLGVFAVSRKKA